MLGLPCALRRWIFGILVIAAFALLGSGAPAASLYAFIPLDSPVAASVDVPWLWNTIAQFRDNAQMSRGLHDLDKMLGLSVEKDVLPWAGQAGFALTAVTNDGPRMAFFLQIRDAGRMIDAARLETALQQLLAGRTRVTWHSLDYQGIPIQYVAIPQGYATLKVATATVDGWLIITVGEGVIRGVIDTQHGDSPSLEKHPSFAKAMAGLPADAPGQFIVNGQGILTQIKQNDPESARDWEYSELGKGFLAGALTSPDQQLQCDLVYCTLSPTTQATLKQLRTEAGPVTGTSLSQLPAGAFATVLVSKPDKWFGAVKRLMLDSLGNVQLRREIRRAFGEIDGLRDVLQRCTGELSASVAWREGKGFGVTMTGETGSVQDATAAAADLGRFFEEMREDVAHKDNLYTLPSTKEEGDFFRTLLCWTAKQQWVLGATHPDWLIPAAQPPLEVPAMAKDAHLAAFGDFSFLPHLLKAFGADNDTRALFTAMKLDRAQWALTLKIDEDGGALRCHLTGAQPLLATAAALTFPAFARAGGKARETKSLSNLRQLALSAVMYAQEHDERLPAIKTTADITKLLSIPSVVLVSPCTNEPYAFNYYFSGRSLGSIPEPQIRIIFYEKNPGPDGMRCVAFLDGHVELVQSFAWEDVKRRSKLR